MADYMHECDKIEKALNEMLDSIVDEHRTSDAHERMIRDEYKDAFQALDKVREGIRRFRRGRR